jgi:hypothetical protein
MIPLAIPQAQRMKKLWASHKIEKVKVKAQLVTNAHNAIAAFMPGIDAADLASAAKRARIE